jgi:AcrR family transcriptional regulator
MERQVVRTRPGAGRPTREQAEQRHVELLDHALDIFLDKGFEQATMEMIAGAVGMTKRTVYARYEDKRALFRAAVQRALDQYVVPEAALRAAETEDLGETLRAIAWIRLENATRPLGLKLQRIIVSETYRFPEMAEALEFGMRPTLDFIAELLRRHAAAGAIVVEDPDTAAFAFLSMAVGGPVRAILSGKPPPPRETMDARLRFCVRLFLDGARPR